MFRTTEDFLSYWKAHESDTDKVLSQLSDASLSQAASKDGRTLGRLGWHLVQSIPGMLREAGLAAVDPPQVDEVPRRAATIRDQYKAMSKQMMDLVRSSLTDADLAKTVPMYGETWSLGTVLLCIVVHEVHHRGQMTVIMRQAGLKVPGVYGPALEEWASMGMQPPAI